MAINFKDSQEASVVHFMRDRFPNANLEVKQHNSDKSNLFFQYTKIRNNIVDIRNIPSTNILQFQLFSKFSMNIQAKSELPIGQFHKKVKKKKQITINIT